MNAHAIGSLSTIPSTSSGAPNSAAPAPAAVPFEHELHAARQRGGPAAQDQASHHEAHPKRGPDPARDRSNDPSPLGPHARHSDSGTGRVDKNPDDGSSKSDAASTAPSAPRVTDKPPLAAATNTAALAVMEATAGAASSESAPVEEDADGREQDVVALVGVMLALVGPAADKVLMSDAAAPAGASGKPVAGDAGAAALLQVSDAATLAATANVVTTAMPAQLLAADGLLPGLKNGRDSTRVDATAGLALSASATSASATPVSAPIPASTGGHAFAQELGQQVAWYVGHDVKQARIRLHPEELGSLDLKISVNHGRVDVVFHAQHPGAVAAVQQSLPQLDQMLAQHGLSLGNAEVGQQDRGDQRGHAGGDGNASEIDEIHGASLATPLSQLGLLDAFA